MTGSKLPLRIYNAAQVRELDRLAIESRGIPGLTLMRLAAAACVEAILSNWSAARKVVVYCGSGNNAGDGYIVAGMLAEKNFDVTVVMVGDIEKLGPDATSAFEYCKKAGTKMLQKPGDKEITPETDVIVDALLGTGTRGEVRPEYKQVIADINAGDAHVLSVDIPSGLSADTGSVLGAVVRADITVTFIGLKQGLLTHDGPDNVGKLVFDQLGIPDDIFDEVEPSVERLDYEELIRGFPKRRSNVHKNRFGHVLVVGGDQGMGGAVLMAAEAALLCGAGLVTVATHESHAAMLMVRCPELMVRALTDENDLDVLLARATVLVLGPGLGKSDWSKNVFDKVIESELPTVIDADALTLLALNPRKRANWVLTPHPGEAMSLLGEVLSENQSVQADRFSAIRLIQDRYGGVVLLKGLGSLIQSKSGTFLSQYGNPGMSSAGMGDVLTGVIAGLIAQGCQLLLAVQLGTVIHSLAADQNTAIEGERGLKATDLMPAIRRLVNGI